MADSIEIRIDQLTQAIKGLYAKSSMSQGEIYNTLTSLSQRYENLTNVSNEKIAALLVGEFRKTIDSKYGQTNQYLKDLENSLKGFMQTLQTQNPKMASEITRLLNETSSIYSKLNSQDLALQKIFDFLESRRNSENTSEEIVKLSENFMAFSRGFENITITLNKNFADFLNQLRQNSTKEEFRALQAEVNTISGNINSIISAISVIDSKYKDLTGLISTVQQRENIFNDALREVRNLTTSVNSIKDAINSMDSKSELQALNGEIRNQIENVKYEIQKIINTASDADFRTEVYNISSSVNGIQTNFNDLSGSISGTKEEIKSLIAIIQGLGLEIKNMHTLVNDEIIFKTRQNDENYQRYLNNFREEMKTLLVGLTAFKKDLTAINEGNIKILQEPIEHAIESLKDQEIGKYVKELSDNLRDVTIEIQGSIQNMQTSLSDMSNVSAMQILTEISDNIPTIADKLEIFRTHVVSENSANLGEIRAKFSETTSEIRDSLSNCVDRIQDEVKTINIETMDTMKVDMQRLSDSITDSVDGLGESVKNEVATLKSDVEESYMKNVDSIERIFSRLSSLEVGLENFSADTIEKVNDTINTNNAHSQDTLNEIKSDILEGIINLDKSNKNSLGQFELKIDKMLDSYFGADLDSIQDKKSLRETVVGIESKIERTNLQQIHNAKELLEEIQAVSSTLSNKIAALEENKNATAILGVANRVAEKVQSIEEGNAEFAIEIGNLKDQLELRLKESVHKIAALIANENASNSGQEQNNANFDNLSNKIQEYISNFEFLKSNISQEIKENLQDEFSKIAALVSRISSSEEKPSYTYSLEDVESDLAKIRLALEKNLPNAADSKSMFEKLVELRTVGLENVKLNRDVDNELGHISSWIKEASEKVDDALVKLDEIQNNGFEEIKTRIVQSEKSKYSSEEHRVKVEKALNMLIKSAKKNDEKSEDLSRKLELLANAQAESFNPNQFIDIFYDNMTQTKMLSNRVEIIEDKINSLQHSIEKLISYVEQ